MIDASAHSGLNLDKQIDGLINLHSSGRLDDAAFSKRYQPLKVRIENLQAEQIKLKAKAKALTLEISRGREAIIETQNINQRYPSLTFNQKRRLVETVVERLTVDDETVTFSYLFNPKV